MDSASGSRTSATLLGRLRQDPGCGRSALATWPASPAIWTGPSVLWTVRDLLRDELAGPNPTPLKRLLVERIVACWLHLHHLEAIYSGKESMSLDLGSYYQRSISSAQKRYLAAIKTLAVVRKLAVPVLPVNIARKQVNVAGPCVAADSDGGTP
jgi:hypothetical protein